MTDASQHDGRDGRGRFGPGNPGGPGGARRRASDLRRAAVEAITPEHIEAMIRKATRMGLEGNLAAMRLVFERTCGRVPEAPLEAEPLGITLPRTRTAADCDLASEKLVEGLCQGTVGDVEAKVLMDALLVRLKAIETNLLETRLTDLEKATASIGAGRPHGGRRP